MAGIGHPNLETAARLDDQARIMMVAQLIGMRIMSGISLKEMGRKMGLRNYRHLPFWRRWPLSITERWWLARLMRKVEDELHDATLSTIMRYARCVGVSFAPQLQDSTGEFTRPERAKAARRRHRSSVLRARQIRHNRRR